MGSFFSSTWNPDDHVKGVPNLQGKVAIVTGAKYAPIRANKHGYADIAPSAGIGYEVAAGLAKRGAKVYLGARSESKAQAAIEQLYSENPNIKKGNLVFLPVDLADLDSVANAVKSFTDHEERLDMLG